MSALAADSVRLAPAFAGTRFDALTLLEAIGRGQRSRVYRARWQGGECALKVYEPRAAERHRRLTGESIAQFEHARNLAYFRAPDLGVYVAEPLGCAVAPGVEALAQELLRGEIYYHYFRAHGGSVAASLATDLARMVALAHAAGLYDMDLHAMNVMVVGAQDGSPRPKLFDFNLIPFDTRPQNFLIGWLLREGLMSPRSRDLRRLKNFHRFGPIERRLARRTRNKGPFEEGLRGIN